MAILSSALAVMHPDMYLTGHEAMTQLGMWATEKGLADMVEVMGLWPSVYSITSVMVNQSSPMYKDVNSQPQWLDLLISVGEYSDLDMVLTNIGMRL